jgi:uncharacterized protein involved in outer membrane biogenesis
MMKILKWLGLSIAALVLLLVATVAFMDWNWVKDAVANQLSEQLGRNVTIAGDLDVDLSLTPQVRVNNIRLDNAPWAEAPHMATIEELVFSIDLLELLTGQIVIPTLTVIDPEIILAISEQGKENWTFDTSPTPEEDKTSSDSALSIPVIKQVTVKDGRMAYYNHAAKPTITAVVADFQAQGSFEEPLLVTGTGELQDYPLEFKLDGAALESFYNTEHYPIDGQASVGETDLTMEGTLPQSGALSGLDLAVSLQSPDAAVMGAVLGMNQVDLPGYELQAQVARQDNTWRFTDLEARLGQTDISGQLTARITDQDPLLQGALTSNTVDVVQLRNIYNTLQTHLDTVNVGGKQTASASGDAKAAPDTTADSEQGLPISERREAILNKLQAWTADVNVQADEIITQPLTINDFTLQLDLEKNGQLKVTPLKLAVYQGSATLNLALDASQWPLDGFIDGQLQDLDLAKLVEAYAITEQQLGVLSGDIDMEIQDMDLQVIKDDDVALPLVGRLTINPSQLTYTDTPNNTVINASLVSEGLQSGEQVVRIDGDGRYLGEPFNLSFTGDQLLALRDPDRAYSLDLEVAAADTTARIEGWIKNVFALKGLDLNLFIEGPNPERLYPLTGLPLPDLPPYKLSGDLAYQKDYRWLFTNIDGRVGDSDLSGEMSLDISEPRPRIKADLFSQKLDLDDLGGVIGAAPGTGPGETASPEQEQEAQQDAQDKSVLPDEPINLERLQAMDAVVDYKAKRVQIDKVPLDSLSLEMKLEDGHLHLKPFKFGVGDGSISSNLEISAGARPIQSTLETEIQHVNLKKVVQPYEIADDTVGMIGGRAKLWMSGDTIADFLDTADGGLYVLMTDGQLDGLLIELAGFDWGEAMMALFNEQSNVAIRCAYLNMHANNGVTNIKNAIVDTEDTIFAATGSLDLGEETLDIVLEPHPKDASFLSTQAPVHIEGTFKNPRIFPGPAALASQAALTAALTAVAGPIGAALSFVEPGLTDDSNYCTGLIDSIAKLQ